MGSESGQAMIELMLGVIMILILVAGGVQLADIMRHHSAIDARIRGDAGVIAMSPLLFLDTPDYILTWDGGRDRQRFTADDRRVPGDPAAIKNIADHTARQGSQDWGVFLGLHQPSSIEALHQTPVPMMALGFVGVRCTVQVPVSDIVQELVYASPEVKEQEDCWMPVMRGLY